MKSEIRNPKLEPRSPSVSLTPSELAALLGPAAVPAVELSTVNVPPIGWIRFSEAFARALTVRLRPLIRAAVRVTPTGSGTLTAESHLVTHDARAAVHFWQSPGSVEPLAITLSAPLVATFVDRLLGGRSTPNCDDADDRRPLTDVDHRLASRLIEAVRLSLIEQAELEALPELSDLPPSATSFADAWLPDCSLLRLTFELRFVQGGGSLDLLLPLEIAAVFADEPIAAGIASTAPGTLPSEETPLFSKPRSTVVARFAPSTLPRSDPRMLAVGDVLLTEATPQQPLQVLIDGQLRFRATLGTVDGNKAIRLGESLASRPDC